MMGPSPAIEALGRQLRLAVIGGVFVGTAIESSADGGEWTDAELEL